MGRTTLMPRAPFPSQLPFGVVALALAACVTLPSGSNDPRPNARGPNVSKTKVATAVASEAIVTASESNAAPPAPRSPYAYANIDPDDDLIVGPPDDRPSCEADLVAAGIKFDAASLPIHVAPKSKITCGASQVVMYRGSPEKIAYSPSVMITCTMALALARFETVLQDEAARTFGKRVVKIHHIGTYACREMAAYPGWVSEHSYANAIDLVDFVLEDGRTLDVLKRFDPTDKEPKSKPSAFLRDVAGRAFDEEIFSTVLTPFFDAHHRNHFHLDLARFRTDGTQFYEAP